MLPYALCIARDTATQQGLLCCPKRGALPGDTAIQQSLLCCPIFILDIAEPAALVLDQSMDHTLDKTLDQSLE